MYILNESQIESVQSFINKISDSLIKSRCEKWLAEVSPTGRCTSEQMEQFVSFATHLPNELQPFPQSFAQAIKNIPQTEKREAKGEGGESANLMAGVDDSISHVEDVFAPGNEEETLHKLGTKKGGKPADKKTHKK